MRPALDRDGGFLVSMNIVAKSVEDVNLFMNNLEKSGAFVAMLSRQDHVTEQGTDRIDSRVGVHAGRTPRADAAGSIEAMTLWRRILREHRTTIVPIVLGLLLNVAAYALWVYPLGVKSAGAADRAAAAAQSLRGAERDIANARALVGGKSRAEQELATFYDKVLPEDLSAARRLTYASLPELARKTNVKFLDRAARPRPARRTRGSRCCAPARSCSVITSSFRQFIYALESAPEFVIIDNVVLTQPDPNKPLTLSLDLSTYYLVKPHGD